MVSIQLDDKTARTIEAAAIVAGVSISDFVSSFIFFQDEHELERTMGGH